MEDAEKSAIKHTRSYEAIVNSQDETVQAMRELGLISAAEQNLKDKGLIGEKDNLTKE